MDPRRSRTAVAPIERLKILMQVQGNEKVYTGVWQVRLLVFHEILMMYTVLHLDLPIKSTQTLLYLIRKRRKLNVE